MTDVNVTELQTYLGIWMEGSRLDMSHEASRQRELYLKLLEESTRDDVRELANVLSRFGDKWSILVLYQLHVNETGILCSPSSRSVTNADSTMCPISAAYSSACFK